MNATATAGRDAVFEQRLLDGFHHQQRSNRIFRVVLGICVPLLLLAVWETLSKTHQISHIFYPAPTTIFWDLVHELQNSRDAHRLGTDLWVTIRDAGMGFGIGATIGITLGLAMGISRLTFFAFGPTVYGTLPTPKLILYPMFIIIFGLGTRSTVAITAIGVFYYMSIHTLAGVRFSQNIYAEVGKVFAIPRRWRYRKIVVPAALPLIITGIRLALGASLLIALAVEFISSTNGIGVYIWDAWTALNVPRVFAGLAVMVLVGGSVVMAGDLLEYLAVPWKRDA